jgi:glyoxylase-like metal-dependent hydrolase (beta-lactamase superfamily II)
MVDSDSSSGWGVQVVKVGSERGPAVSVYWNDRLTDSCDLYYYVVVLRKGERTILINTGLPDDIEPFDAFVRDWHSDCRISRSEDERTAVALAHVGVDPAQVERVILTPLTIYTTGQLRLFPKARFAVSRTGWIDFWAPAPHAPRLPSDIAIARESRIYLAGEALDRIDLLEDEAAVEPGIEVFRTGGHHASSMAVKVTTDKGPVILGDCFFTYDNLEKNIPIGWHENLHEIYTAYARVRREAAIAVPLYDPEVLRRYPGGRIA